MLNIAYAHARVVLIIFDYYMLQNKQYIIDSYFQHDVSVCAIAYLQSLQKLVGTLDKISTTQINVC